MKSRSFLGGMLVLAMAGIATTAITVFRLDPLTSTSLAVPFFFAGTFFGGIGLLTLLGFYLRVWTTRGEIYTLHLSTAFRQAVLLSVAICLALALSTVRVLTWYIATLIAIAIILVEVYFAGRD